MLIMWESTLVNNVIWIYTVLLLKLVWVNPLKLQKNLVPHYSVTKDSILKFHYQPHWEGEKLVLDEHKIQNNDTIYSFKNRDRLYCWIR